MPASRFFALRMMSTDSALLCGQYTRNRPSVTTRRLPLAIGRASTGTPSTSVAVDAERVTRPDAVSALLLLSRYQSICVHQTVVVVRRLSYFRKLKPGTCLDFSGLYITWLGGTVVKALDLDWRSKVQLQPLHCRLRPSACCSQTFPLSPRSTIFTSIS